MQRVEWHELIRTVGQKVQEVNQNIFFFVFIVLNKNLSEWTDLAVIRIINHKENMAVDHALEELMSTLGKFK